MVRNYNLNMIIVTCFPRWSIFPWHIVSVGTGDMLVSLVAYIVCLHFVPCGRFCIVDRLSGWHIVLGQVGPGGMLSPGGRLSPGGTLSVGILSRGILSQVAYCLGGMLSRGILSRGILTRGILSRGVKSLHLLNNWKTSYSKW